MTEQMSSPRATSRTRRLGSVLVPVDGSAASERALEYAAYLEPERVVLLRVVEDEPVDEHADPVDPYERWRHDQLSGVMDELEALAREHVRQDVAIEPKVRFGHPAEQIMAEGHDHELILIGASGKGAAGRLLFGSVADRVMRYSVTPTLVVRAGKRGTAIEHPVRVVVPLDGSELAETAVPLALRAATALSLPIRLIRCVGMDEVLRTVRAARHSEDRELFTRADDPYKLGQERAEQAAQDYLEGIRDRIASAGQEITCDVIGGSAAFELLYAVNEDDLVVMTSRGEGGLQRWMIGSVAQKLVREAQAPVLLVPVGRAGMEPE